MNQKIATQSSSPEPTSNGGGILPQLVERVSSMYSLPAVAMEVVRLTNEPRVDAKQIKQCVEKDPALTAKILRFVNSPAYGMSRQVSNLDQAVALLGTNPLRMLVLGFSLPRKLFDGVDQRVLSRYWRQTLTKALAARELSKVLGLKQADEAFIAGLLQNVGMLVLIQELGGTYLQFLSEVWAGHGNLSQLEIASMGFDHRILSARLLEKWQLPQVITLPIAQSDNFESVTRMTEAYASICRQLHVADLIAETLATRNDHDLPRTIERTRNVCGIPFHETEALLLRLDTQLHELASVLQLNLGEGVTFEEMLLSSREQLLKLSELQVVAERHRTSEEQPAVKSNPHLTGPAFKPDLSGVPGKANPPKSPTSSGSEKPGFSNGSASLSEFGAKPTIDPGLKGRLHLALAHCRQKQACLTLMLVDIANFHEILMRHGIDQVDRSMQDLRQLAVHSIDPGDVQLQISDSRMAIIMEDCDRSQSHIVGRTLMQLVRAWSQQRVSHGQSPMVVNVGVACLNGIPKSFEADELIAKAERCLETAALSGGDTMKTIDI